MQEQATAEIEYRLSMMGNFFNTNLYIVTACGLWQQESVKRPAKTERHTVINNTQDWFPYLNAIRFGAYLVSMLL